MTNLTLLFKEKDFLHIEVVIGSFQIWLKSFSIFRPSILNTEFIINFEEHCFKLNYLKQMCVHNEV
jgi:hypothetical protein